MTERSFVSLIVPCQDEERFIGPCLESLIAGDYPKDRLEVLVVDGMSTDGTRAIVQTYIDRQPYIRLLENPKRIIPAAMNIGIRSSRGAAILKIDAHSTYSTDYISKCVRYLSESGADNVGGVLVTRPSADTTMACAIALVLAHPFGSGNSYFRVGSREPRWSDTAAFGCYRRDVFERVGLYNEDLVRSSDMDLNTRLQQSGGRILLVPQIVAEYYPRAELGDFFVRNLVDGYWALYPLKFGGRGIRIRHLVPVACVIALVLGLVGAIWVSVFRWITLALVGAYVVLDVGVSSRLSKQERSLELAASLPIVFAVRHVAYGLGSLWGAVRAFMARGFWSSLLADRRYPLKRLLDIVIAATGLLLLFPLLLAVAVAINLQDGGPVLYLGERVGRSGRRFLMFKFRTMVLNAERLGATSTTEGDPRITRIGRVLREYKLDEIPQLLNVLKGDMSIVGPRPQVPWAVELYDPHERALLTVRPGMTDYASIRFSDEWRILRGSVDPDGDYLRKIAPEKIRLGLEYVRNHSLTVDLKIILATAWAVAGGNPERVLRMTGVPSPLSEASPPDEARS